MKGFRCLFPTRNGIAKKLVMVIMEFPDVIDVIDVINVICFGYSYFASKSCIKS